MQTYRCALRTRSRRSDALPVLLELRKGLVQTSAFMLSSSMFRNLTSCLICLLLPIFAAAGSVAPPGDMQLRNDLQLLNDSGFINVPLTAWPVAYGDVDVALRDIAAQSLNGATWAAYERVRSRLRYELTTDETSLRLGLSGASNPRIIRTFENTPREEGEVRAELGWLGERFTVNLAATYAANPLDGDEFRPDGTYLGIALGNWMVTAGWQERWWGPGRDGSLILSTNSRSRPGISLQRNNSTAFKTKWLSWMGPWTLATFMDHLDDERHVNDALLFGFRGSFRPPRTGLELGFSRTAQWCGDGRPCDLSTFSKLLIGNDNRGSSLDIEDEPGNQLAGFDMRWTLPKEVPVALYAQWIAEDNCEGCGPFGAWLRQVGLEHWGQIGQLSHRTHFEVSETTCREGRFGTGEERVPCAYEHSIYKTGYRYNGRSIGHSGDGDTLSYSLGSTLIDSLGHTWNVSLRFLEINRIGMPNNRHTLSPTPQDLLDIQISHDRLTHLGRFYAGIGYSQLDDMATDVSDSEFSAFVRWSSR